MDAKNKRSAAFCSVLAGPQHPNLIQKLNDAAECDS
jgi:hypothetical protein